MARAGAGGSGGQVRRGRPRSGEREQRRRRILDAALAELIERGYEGVTMLGIARRAGASKETLYSWFGDRDGLFRALIEANADASAERIRAGMEREGDDRDVLVGYAEGLLLLLTGEASVALNRAAMSSPELADLLLRSGRHRIGPVVEAYLSGLSARGVLAIDETADAFRLLYGLVVQDTQIRVLLGERPPSGPELARQATMAVDRFLELVATSPR